MSSYTHNERLLNFTSPLGDDVLLIEGLSGHEGLSHLFEYDVQLLAAAGASIDPADIVGKKVTIGITLLDVTGTRYINGIVASFEQSAGDEDFDNYRARVVPALWQATLSSTCRVFQDKDVMAIVKEVLDPYGLSISDQTDGSLKPLEYCTQYRETDFDFISRILEQHGVFYWFKHTDTDHRLLFSNTRSVYEDCAYFSNPNYAPQAKQSEDYYASIVHSFMATSTMVSGKHTRWDYDFRDFAAIRKDPSESKSSLGKNALERFSFLESGDAYVKKTSSKVSAPDHVGRFADVDAGSEDAASVVYRGESNARTFEGGYTFTLSMHPNSSWNSKFLITSVVHRANQAPSYRTRDTSFDMSYSNAFMAVPSDVLFQPAAVTPKPRMYGPQPAVVVVPSGEEQYIDKYGRVCVQFLWDRVRSFDNVDNTYVRVAQQWAGSGWGTYFWPRIKDEVLIAFIDGDPDNPIIVGSVYNGTNMPKYALPDNSTRSGILTRSTKDGGSANANELRFEDKMGAEQIFLNAERDMDHRVEHDHRTYVGNEQHLMVSAKQLEEIGADKQEKIDGNHIEKVVGQADRSVGSDFNEAIGSNYSMQVGQNYSGKVGSVYVVDSGEEVHIKGGMKVVVESGMSLCLSAAGGFITIDPSGVTIQGMLVKINSGGAQIEGSPAQTQDPQDPTAPDIADDWSKGGKM